MQKTDLSYLYNCQFHSVLLSELFKMADFFFKFNLKRHKKCEIL